MINLTATLKRYFKKNTILMRLYRNVGILFGGNALYGIFSLLALAILTRAISLDALGQFTLITAYIMIVDRLVSFQTWMALIHYGTEALHENAFGRLSSLFVFGYILDFLSSVLGVALAIAGAYYIPHLFGIEQLDKTTIWLAALILLSNWIATPTAILRIFNKFVLQALCINVTAMIRLFGYFFLWQTGNTNVADYIAFWVLGGVTGNVLLFIISWFLARHKNLLRYKQINLPKMFKEISGLWHFVTMTNFDGIIRILREIDVFIVNAILGTSGTALYKIARSIGTISTQLTGPFYQAIYPELAKMASHRDWNKFKKLMRHSSFSLGLMIGVGLLIFVLMGKWIIMIGFGESYVAAYSASIWILAAFMMWGFSQSLSPAMMAIKKVQTSLVIHIITSIVYIGLLSFLALQFGLIGAGVSLFLFYSLWAFTMLMYFNKYSEKLVT